MSKSEVVRGWKPELKSLGFSWQKGAFYLSKTKNEPLQFIISVQKNLHADTYKINPTIILSNPLIDSTEPELFLMANLRKDGIYLHVITASWWPVASLGEALDALKTYALPWFHDWGRPEKLVEIQETVIREKKSFITLAEPVSPESTSLPWHQGQPEKIRVAPLYFYQAAVLHYLNHNISRAVARTRDWMAHLSPNEMAAMAKAQAQLSMLEKIRTNSLQ